LKLLRVNSSIKEFVSQWVSENTHYKIGEPGFRIDSRSTLVSASQLCDLLEPFIYTDPDFTYLHGLYEYLKQPQEDATTTTTRKRPRESQDGISIRIIESADDLPSELPPTCCQWGVESDTFSFDHGSCNSGFVKGKTFEIALHGHTFQLCFCQMHQLLPYVKPGFKRGNLVDHVTRRGQVQVRGVLDGLVLMDDGELQASIYLLSTEEHILTSFDSITHADCRPQTSFQSGEVVYAPYKPMAMHPYSMKRAKAVVIDKQLIADDPKTDYYRVCVERFRDDNGQALLLAVPAMYLEKAE